MNNFKQNIDELGTTEKPMFNSGMEHQIYGSKSNPNALFKIGHKDIVDEWYDVFKSNPDIFPKVFRSGKMQDKNIYYVELEKLDTSKFEDKWNELENALEEIGALDIDRGESFSDLYMNEGSDASVFKEIAKNLSIHDKNAYNFFIELLTLIKNAERAILDTKGRDTIVDVHKYNFGYDSDGKIKCLDL